MTASQALPAGLLSRQGMAHGCYHCGLPIPAGSCFEQEINGAHRQFCCPACQAVCHAIFESGLEGFYERTPEDRPLAPPPDVPQDLALYDLDEVQAEFMAETAVKRRINLLVEGIHCPACVWLIERSLERVPGVRSVRVNLSGKRLLLDWDNSQVRLSQLLARLGQIGYAAVPFNPEVAEGRLQRHNRALLLRMAFAAFAMMNLMWISIALYSGASESEFRTLFHWVGFSLATPTLFYSGFPFLRSAWTGLWRLHLTMDLPIAIGALSTWGYSVYVTVSATTSGEVYYDTVVNFLFVILTGRYLEAMSRRQAVSSTQRLLDLQPRAATVLKDGQTELWPVRAVSVGDKVLIRPGERIPVDGTVTDGRSSVDESMLSGESRPQPRRTGDSVHAGTINLDSALTVQVSATLHNTSLGRIIDLVEEAQASRAPIQCIADRIVPWFVGITIILAVLSFNWWFSSGFETALMAATAVLIITCPCAFGLATPMAVAAASGLGARVGILVRNGGVLETLSRVDHYIFDKTGTLTEGRPRIVEVVAGAGRDVRQLMGMAAALEHYSEHSLARAVIDWAGQHHLDSAGAEDVENIPGYGIRGRVGGQQLLIGSLQLLKERTVVVDERVQQEVLQHEQQGSSCIHIAVDGEHCAFMVVNDPLRRDAGAVIDGLRQRGHRLTILSGDRQAVAQAVARELGGMNTVAEVLPEDKERIVAGYQRQDHTVAMIGDGINDAPALARADVGIALGSGTDVSGESADIVLMSDGLDKILLASQLSRRTLRTIWQNIAISITYNIIMVPLAMAAMITPLIAAISMPISSLLVIGNAARIRTLFNKREQN